MTQDGSGMANVHAQIVYLETNVRGLTKGDTDGPDDVVRLPTSGRTPLSPHSRLAHLHRARYTVRLIPNAVMREGERTWLYAEYWWVHICLRPGELYLGSWSSQRRLHLVFYDRN